MSKDQRTRSKPLPPEASFIGLPKKITELLNKESDRGAILILSAYLDEILGLIVRAAATSDKLGKGLMELRGPAGDFSSKILLCEAFGLISSDEAKALNILRKIRNAAAHFDAKGRGFDVLFDSPDTAKQVKAFANQLDMCVEAGTSESGRKIFVTSGRFLATRLFTRLSRTGRAAAARSAKDEAIAIRERIKNTAVGRILAEAEGLAKSGQPEFFWEFIQAINQEIQKCITTTAEATKGHQQDPAQQL